LFVVLHPGFKLKWYKQTNWPKEWISGHRKLFSDEWSQKYKSTTVVAMNSESSSEEGDFFGALYRSQMGSMAKGPPDELTKYLAEPIVSTDSMKSTGLLGWWKVA